MGVAQKNVAQKQVGVLMPVFSLPSKGAIGTFGPEAFRFVDWLVETRQKYWQVLPLTVTDGSSPYMGFSSFAGNPYLVSLEILKKDGLLELDEVPEWNGSLDRVNYDWVWENHTSALRKAYNKAKNSPIWEEVEAFAASKEEWLMDYAMFMAIKDHFQKPLWEWDEDIRRRQKRAMNRYKKNLADEINFHIFLQFIFHEQWMDLKRYANKKGIQIVGDIPIYVSSNSADVWAHPNLFKVDPKTLKATKVAGCPPDAYAETGQLWGNPVYKWPNHKRQKYEWWRARIKNCFDIYDVLRIDHFRGFSEYWEVDASEETAINGKWVKGPKKALFKAINEDIPNPRIIAEDLGTIDNKVRRLLKWTGFPGMKVAIFGLTEEKLNEHSIERWPKTGAWCYTSTHDSPTVRGLLEDASLKERARKRAMDRLHIMPGDNIGLSATREAYKSEAEVVIVPFWDIFDMIERMNKPSTVHPDNWSCRADERLFNDESTMKLSTMVLLYAK